MDENKWHNRIMHLTSFSMGIVVTALMMAKGMFELIAIRSDRISCDTIGIICIQLHPRNRLHDPKPPGL
jgi:hypothetical protein